MNLLHQRLEAHAVHPDNGNELVEGVAILSTHSLRFEFDSGVWEIPIERLRAEVRVGDEERIALTDEGQPGLVIFTADLTLLDCGTSHALVSARQQLTARLTRREMNRRMKMLAYTLVTLVILTWLGSVFVGAMVQSIAARIPAEWDAEYGAEALKELRSEETFLEDSNAVARLAGMAAPLLRTLPPPPNGHQFYIVEQEDPNAFALPGGHIVVTTGLLQIVDRPEQLMGVIAHEVAHVTQRHTYRKQISMAGPVMICEIFFSGRHGTMGVLGVGTAMVLGADFSQEFETEADNIGWDYLVKANIDPHGMIETFQKFKQLDDGEEGFLPQSLSSHPTLDKRIRHLEGKWVKLPQKTGFVQLDREPVLKPNSK